MKKIKLKLFVFFAIIQMAGCSAQVAKVEPVKLDTLTTARHGFKTNLLAQERSDNPVRKAPSNVFKMVKYTAASGDLAAYVTPKPSDGKKHPAIIWIVGGDSNSIDDVWSSAPRSNDQTAAAYRQAGIVMMFPSLRGGNNNPGIKEGFLGEVDDILDAVKFVEKQDYVDPKRIYLGGHSTGGTLVLLAAESSNRFRAVFSFGPVDDVSGYGIDSGFLPFDVTNREEVVLRSPIYWLHSIQTPVWAFEGGEEANTDSLRAMAETSKNPLVHFIEIEKATHFSALAPTNDLIAKKILKDTNENSNISFTKEEVNQYFNK